MMLCTQCTYNDLIIGDVFEDIEVHFDGEWIKVGVFKLCVLTRQTFFYFSLRTGLSPWWLICVKIRPQKSAPFLGN